MNQMAEMDSPSMDEIVKKLDIGDLITLMRWMRLSVEGKSSVRS
jgi:hypothetical protein